jgi:outer membrane protein OmpA-like peptidoglycan-associated protein
MESPVTAKIFTLMIASPLSKRWFVILTVTLVLFAALLVGAPFLIKHLARQWLLENGGSEVQFRDVDFNPFSATLLLKDLDVKVDQETTLSFASAGLDLAWMPLFHKQIKVQSVELAGFRMVVDNHDMLRIGGIRLPEADAEAEPPDSEATAGTWLSGIDSLALRDFHIVYRDQKIETRLVLDRLLLSHLAQWTPDEAAHLELSGSLNGAPIEMNAELTPLAETADYRGTVTLRDLALDRFAGLTQAQLEELGGIVTLESDFSVRLTQGNLNLTHKGSLDLTDLKLVSDAAQIDNRGLNWTGDLDLTQSPDSLRISHSGGLALEHIKLVSDALQLDGQTGNFTGELSLTQSSDGLRVSHSGGLALAQLKLVSDAGVIDNQSTRWDGTTAVQLAGADPLLKLETEGALVVGQTSADLQQPPIHFEQQQFSHQGSFSFAQGDPDPSVKVSSNLGLQGLRMEAEERKFKLADVKDLRVSGLQVEALDALAIDAIEADELYLAQSADPDANGGQEPGAFLHIARTRIDKPAYAGRLLSIDSIEYDGWHGQAHRNKEGQWTIVRFIDVIKRIAQGPEPAAEDEAQAGGEAEPDGADDAPGVQPVQFAIQRIEVASGSTLNFVDESVKPVFKTKLDFEQLKLEHIDSRQPEQPTSLVLNGKIGKHTRLALQGELRPFRQPPGLNLKGSIDAMDLPQLSSYTRGGLGLLLNSGTLDAKLNMQTKAEQLDGKATLELHQLQLKSVPGENTLQSKIPVPLDTALDTLRDKNNTIELEIPVAGNVDDPKFSVNDAISQALAKGVQKGALSYLTLALQPYGTLITAAKYAGEAATRVQLNPVEFEPGQSVLDDSDREYLDKVAKVLKDRPKIAIKLCGVAASRDRLFFQQQQQKQQQQQQAAKPPAQAQGASQLEAPVVDETKLSEIAEQRAAVVKDFLIEKHKVPASRLVGCLPQLEIDDAKAQPRTDLLI